MSTAANPSESDLGTQLRAAVGRAYRRFRSERVEGSLGDTALAVLVRLHKHGPQSLTELSDFGRVTPASMSQTVNRLTSGGYAIRVADASDRRKVRFCPTPEGAVLAAGEISRRNAWLDAKLNLLSAEDRAVIARASELMCEFADS